MKTQKCFFNDKIDCHIYQYKIDFQFLLTGNNAKVCQICQLNKISQTLDQMIPFEAKYKF